MKKLFPLILCLSCLLTAMAPAAYGAYDAFPVTKEYRSALFADVSPEDWFAPSVRQVYERGLMDGLTPGQFGPEESVKLVDVMALAARLHRIYTTGADDFKPGRMWYDVYVRYCLEQGIITSRFGCRRTATRAQVVDILSRALPAQALAQQNLVSDDAIPDVSMSEPYAQSIYTMYRVGIVGGSDEDGTFYPQESVSRAECAALVSRMVDPAQRKVFTMAYTGPDLTAGERQDDEFFRTAAFLGNSLVDGLQIFADFSTVDYYCATSVTVTSAMKDPVKRLSDGSKGTLVEALCEGEYERIYIHLGINEIGYAPDFFQSLYREMVEMIQSAHPDAEIYFMSVLPVTAKRDAAGVFTMERIHAYNDALRALAEDMECYYLDVCSAMMDEEGFLFDEWSPDGVHLYAEHYAVWEEMIRTHYA